MRSLQVPQVGDIVWHLLHPPEKIKQIEHGGLFLPSGRMSWEFYHKWCASCEEALVQKLMRRL